MSTPNNVPSAEHLRAAFRVSVLSVAWTVAASATAIVSGFVAHALVLVVFGLTGVLDAAGSWTLSLHFRHALKHETVSVAREELALRLQAASFGDWSGSSNGHLWGLGQASPTPPSYPRPGRPGRHPGVAPKFDRSLKSGEVSPALRPGPRR